MRVMPPADLYASCPGDEKVLAYYAGTFDAVYVSLSPFIKPTAVSPDLFQADTYPDRRTIVDNCRPVRWSEMLSLTGLPSIAAIDVGLRTIIHGLKAEYENTGFANRIVRTCNAQGIVRPDEGFHSDLLHNDVLDLFQALGHEWVWVGDEFCSERKLHWIDDLKTEEKPTIRGHSNVFSADKSLLWTVHWDSHFSFLCSTRDNLERVKVADRLEGFFCGPETEVYWSVWDHQPGK